MIATANAQKALGPTAATTVTAAATSQNALGPLAWVKTATATTQNALGPLAGVKTAIATTQKALGPLVRSERDILVRFAHSDSCPLRDTRADLALSFHQESKLS
ncbi:MAG: hypothetical protein V5A55_14385 [Halovenus sp.]